MFLPAARALTPALLALLAMTLVHAPVTAASITWSSLNNGVDGDVRTDGLLLEAANFGGTGVPDITVNTVLFTGIDFVAGDTLSNISGLPYNNFQSGHATATGGNIDTLFDTIGFLSGDGSHTVGLTGLTPGSDYLVQFFLHHPNTSTRTLTITNGMGDSIAINNAAGGIVTGEFTADANSQIITLTSNQGSQLLNAYQLRQIPEPTTTLLLGLGGMLLLRRRR